MHSIPNAEEKTGILCQDEFKKMIGVLGKFFLGKRIFETIINLRTHKRIGGAHSTVKEQKYIRLVDYIDYLDMIYHGNQEEKDYVLFTMLDLKAKQKITFVHYEQFWKKFLHMNGELMQVKITYNEQS